MSTVCAFDLAYAGDLIKLLSTEIFDDVESQKLITLVPRGSGEHTRLSSADLIAELGDIPIVGQTSSTSILRLCDESVQA